MNNKTKIILELTLIVGLLTLLWGCLTLLSGCHNEPHENQREGMWFTNSETIVECLKWMVSEGQIRYDKDSDLTNIISVPKFIFLANESAERFILWRKRDSRGNVSKTPMPPAQIPEKRRPTLNEDFVMGSRTAVSNATLHGVAAPGYTVMCDGEGHYAPAIHGFPIVRFCDWNIRTNEWEAIVATWRLQEIADTYFATPIPKNVWFDCP